MARKLPWDERSEPPAKRARTTAATKDASSSPRPNARGRSTVRQTRITGHTVTPTKRRVASRSPSTSPPPGPPETESMMEGYENDDIWMMVEDEFQTLAQSFTAHLHHAEYKRLMQKAKTAPPKQLPEPSSPMSADTKRKLQRGSLDKKQQEALSKITAGARVGDASDDANEDQVDDPWRGTVLAGLMAVGSQEKTSLKGLEKLPSSTRAAKGFSKAAASLRQPMNHSLDEFTGLSRNRNDLQSTSRTVRPLQDLAEGGMHSSTKVSDSLASSTSSKPEKSTSKYLSRPSKKAAGPPPKSSFILKRKQPKEENREDRLAEVPMFLI